MNIKIFRANRGEGKTKWLFERAVEAYENGYELYYAGKDTTMDSLLKMWRAEMHSACPIKQLDLLFYADSKKQYCFLTDELISNLARVGVHLYNIKQTNYIWYATMDKEDFVN